MIITRTPFRMSFFGGGTDMPEFFREHGGAVISTTFDKYCYVTARHLPPFFDYSSEIVYSCIERVKNYTEIAHPLVRNCMQYLHMHETRVTYDADLPARSGLGTSSSFAVGLLNAFHCLKGTRTSKEQLAKEAIHVERFLCNETGGWQDQIAAAYGGFNHISFDGDDFKVKPLIMSQSRKHELNENLLLFFTGFTRFSSDMQRANKVIGKTAQLLEMLDLVDEAQAILADTSAPLSRFGELLDVAWNLKRSTGSSISTDAIDTLYKRAIKAGALGGKLLGAGGGGFLVFYADQPDARLSVRTAMHDLLEIPFEFENDGSTVAYYNPENYETRNFEQ